QTCALPRLQKLRRAMPSQMAPPPARRAEPGRNMIAKPHGTNGQIGVNRGACCIGKRHQSLPAALAAHSEETLLAPYRRKWQADKLRHAKPRRIENFHQTNEARPLIGKHRLFMRAPVFRTPCGCEKRVYLANGKRLGQGSCTTGTFDGTARII